MKACSPAQRRYLGLAGLIETATKTGRTSLTGMLRPECLSGSRGVWLMLLAVLCADLTPAQEGPPNPYGPGVHWGELPPGRAWGSTSAVYPHRDRDGSLTGRIWVAERCARSNCRDSDLDPILLFDKDGTLIRSFGAGMFIWPHGIHADRKGSVWVTDAVHTDCKPGAGAGKGHQVHKFSAKGELLMSLGRVGVEGEGPDTFRCPSDVLVSPAGEIFVADGHNHGHGGNNRIVRFSAEGKFIEAWGSPGSGPGEFRGLHALAMDSQGRLFVGDRANSRIQILDSAGRHVATWKQFGSPSGMYIDGNDRLFVADSDSGYDPDSEGRPRNPGFPRGIYIGDARTGRVEAFIPDPRPNLTSVTSGAEGVAVSGGAVFAAQVGGTRGILRYPPAKEP